MTLHDLDGLFIGRSSIAVRHVALAGRLLGEHYRAIGYQAPDEALAVFSWCELTAEQQRAAFDASQEPKMMPTPAESAVKVASMTSAEVADRLDLTPQRVTQLAKSEQLRGVQDAGGRWQIDPESVDAFEAKRERK